MNTIDSVDRITLDTLRELALQPGPWVTITLPTHRTGPEVRQGPLRLRNLGDRALALVVAHPDAPAGFAADLADRLDALRTNHDFWQRQAEGLVVLGSPSGTRTYRTTATLPEGVRIGAAPGLSELARQVDADEPWYLVAASQNKVVLYEATGHSVTPLPLEGIPASIDDALGDVERQKHLQSAPQGGGDATFHGHGSGKEVDRVWLEKFVRLVATGLEGHSAKPGASEVVLAGVPDMVAALRSQWRAPRILPDAVDGNPDRVAPADLHEAALPLVVAARRASDGVLRDRLGAAGARGLVDAAAIIAAAAEGRVGDLLLGDRVDADVAPDVDVAIRDTLAHGGTVVPVTGLDAPFAALTRY